MGPVLMKAKSTEDDKVFKDKEGNLIPISKLSDKELIEAVKFSQKRADECYKMHEKLVQRASQLQAKSIFFTDLLDNLEAEVESRREAIESKLKELTLS